MSTFAINTYPVRYGTATVDGVRISYHYVIAPDYPGYADSDAPNPATFRYSFERISALINGLLEQKLVYSYAMYVVGYGAPVGWRLALAHPERISALMIQNGDAHEEGLQEFWNPVKKYWADASEENRRDLLGWMSLESTMFCCTQRSRPACASGSRPRFSSGENTTKFTPWRVPTPTSVT